MKGRSRRQNPEGAGTFRFRNHERTGQPRRDLPGRGCCVGVRLSSKTKRKFGRRTCKPNSVVCGHSSRRRIAADVHQRPTRRFRQLLEPPCRIGQMRSRSLALGSHFPPYLVLLRVGFTLPPPLPPERCALTAPFHPYLRRTSSKSLSGRPRQSRKTGEG